MHGPLQGWAFLTCLLHRRKNRVEARPPRAKWKGLIAADIASIHPVESVTMTMILMHSQSANNGKSQINSPNLAPFILLNHVHSSGGDPLVLLVSSTDLTL